MKLIQLFFLSGTTVTYLTASTRIPSQTKTFTSVKWSKLNLIKLILSLLNSLGGLGSVGIAGAWVAWVHENLAWVEHLAWVAWWRGCLKFWRGWCRFITFLYGSKVSRGSETMSISFAFRLFLLDSKYSLHVVVPDNRPFAFLMFISYSNWLGFEIIYRP